ncbi:hypothetical protein BST22_24890 [Mycolicibacterium chubuense]|nr:hypothetical protein BST22_24890 [Mycolicibacterium chubuense]
MTRNTPFRNRKDSTDTVDGSVTPKRHGLFDAPATPVRIPFWQRRAVKDDDRKPVQTIQAGPADTSPSIDPAPTTLLLSTMALATPHQESVSDDRAAKTVAALKTTVAATNQIEVQPEFDNLDGMNGLATEYNRTWVLNVPSWSTLDTSDPEYVPGKVFTYTVARPAGDTLSGADIPANLKGKDIPDNLYVVEFVSVTGTSNPNPYTTLVKSIQRIDSTQSADVVEKYIYDTNTTHYSQIWAFEFDPFAGEDAAPKPPTIKNVTATQEVYTSIDLLVSGGTDDNGIVAYQILKGGQLLTTVDPGEKYTEYGLQSGVTYTYTARSVDTIGQVSADSAPLIITTVDVVKPTAPTIVSSSVNSHSATLTAFGGTDNVGVVGYNIYRDGERINVAPVLAYQPVIDEDLDFDVEYEYTARALDAAFNESEDSRSVKVVTLTPEEDPGILEQLANRLRDHYIPDEDENNSPLEVFFESTMNVFSVIPGVNLLVAAIKTPVDLVQLIFGPKAGRADEWKDLRDDFLTAATAKQTRQLLQELRWAYEAQKATRV